MLRASFAFCAALVLVSTRVDSSAAQAQQGAGPLLPPSGRFPIGRVSVLMVDAARTTPGRGRPRRLMVHVWYPTSKPAPPTLPYMPDLKPAREVLSKEEVGLLESVETHATAGRLETATRSRPMLIFSHGDQTNGFLYSNLLEDLASHGYLVVAVDHPGQALFVAYPDGTSVTYSDSGRPADGTPGYRAALSAYLTRQLAEREADLRFVLSQLGTIEVGGQRVSAGASRRIGALGHSSGGLAATTLCQAPAVVSACVNMDGRLDASPYPAAKQPPSRPFLYVAKPFRALTDEELQKEGLTREQAARSQAETDSRDLRLLANAGAPAYRAVVRQAAHNSFSDEPLLRDPSDAAGARVLELVRQAVRGFFDAALASPARTFEPRSTDDVHFTANRPR